MITNRCRRWLLLLCATVLVACQSPDQQPPREGLQNTAQALAFLRALGDAAVRIDGTEAILRYAPEAMPLLDVGAPDAEGNWVGAGDGVVTLAEIEQLVASSQDPEQLVWLLIVTRALLER